MSCPFVCQCTYFKSLKQPRFVSGFSNLNMEQREEIIHEATPYVRMLAKREVEIHRGQLLHFR